MYAFMERLEGQCHFDSRINMTFDMRSQKMLDFCREVHDNMSMIPRT